MTDPDLQHLADDSVAHEREVAEARAAFADGRGKRHVRVAGHLIDLAAPPVAPSRPDYDPLTGTFADVPAPAVFPDGSLTSAEGLEVGAIVRALGTDPAMPVVEACLSG